MARNVATAIQNNFIGGLVTQATALNFPPNAMFDAVNVVVSERAIVSRRPGFDFENNFVLKALVNSNKVQNTFLWKNAGGDGNTNYVVHQNGSYVEFYNTNSNLSLSAGVSPNTLDLNSFISVGATQDNLDQNECQFAAGLDYLFGVHPYCDPFYVKLNPDGTFTSSVITFTIRDVVGIPEPGVLVDNRSGTMTANHAYNLYNQGWDSSKWNTFYTAASSKFPSNADVWWIYKDNTDIFNPATMLSSASRGSTQAPQGFFRLNPWDTQRQATATAQTAGAFVSTLTNVDETSGLIRPSVVEFHAGRAFYAGVNARGYNSRIYFSRIIQKDGHLGSCMADYDPTNETLFDFLPSDGGIITIPQAGTIYKLVSLNSALLVFGANGVWAITGSVGVGFAATDYTVSPVSAVRSISGTSYVTVEGAVIWWNSTGINIVSQDQNGWGVKSLSDDKIKDFYLDIPTTSKRFARGSYNPRTHVVQWLYRQNEAADITTQYQFDSILSFNTLIGAFYPWDIPSGTISIGGIVAVEGAGSLQSSDTIVDNLGNVVTDNALNPLTTFSFTKTSITTTTKYLVYNGTAFTFGEAFNADYLDWTQAGISSDYTSSFITGYNVLTQGIRKFQSNYVFVFSDLEDGFNAYYFQALWNYGNNRNSGEWSQRQTVSQDIVHAESNYDASRRRLKVRGSGTAVQFKFTSVTGKPFNIIGWSTYDTGNQTP